jgi:cytochrome bd-type quinol oxidase subunit 1
MTNVDLARWQFAFTSINHFLFVPITIGLAVLTPCCRPRGTAASAMSTSG